MVLLIAVIVGVAVFCFFQGYIAFGIACLLGFSKRYGWPALLATSAFLFWNRHWFVASLPPLLIVWNVWGLKYVGAPVSSGQDIRRTSGRPRAFDQKIIATMKQQAANGNPLVQYSLGDLYFDGLGVPQDYAQAAFWYRKVAEQGNAGAQYKLGVLYRYGLGVTWDDAQATAWFRKATEQADAEAQDGHGAAAFMLMALGVPNDYAEAYFWLDLAVAGKLVDAEQVAKYRDEIASHLTPADLARVQERARSIRDLLDADQAKAWFEEGRELWRREHRFAEAAASFRLAAERGHVTAQYNLGILYSQGPGVPQDRTQAAAWFRKAAEQGFAPAQYNLGVSYHKGQGVPQDDTQAAAWYRKAAEQGYARARYNLGVLYDKGQGVPQNDAEIYYLFNLAIADESDVRWRNRMRSKYRDESASHLTPADLVREVYATRKWFEDHPAKPQ